MSDRTFSTVFGPVSSRRLGRSLGVDVIPRKLCTFDCVYCEVGRTNKRGLARWEHVPTDLILDELRTALSVHNKLDCITFSGSGEPTLHSHLGDLIRTTRTFSSLPIAVLTNGTLLWSHDVQNELGGADIVCPSLNAVTEDIFRRINRPHPSLTANLVLSGLIAFREAFPGKYYLEILFVQGLNDTDEEVEALRNACDRIRPDRIDINTVVRPPAETWAKPVSMSRLLEIKQLLGSHAEVLIRHDSLCVEGNVPVDEADILSLLMRRAMPEKEIIESLSAEAGIVQQQLRELMVKGTVHPVLYEGEEYYALAENVPLN